MFAIFVGVAHVLARLFGGQATFGQLSYALAAIEAPYTILSAVFSLLAATPLIGIAFEVLAYGRGIYIIVIQAIAVKGVHRISWAGAFVAAWALPLLLVAGFAACLLVFGLAALAAGAFSALGPLPSP